MFERNSIGGAKENAVKSTRFTSFLLDAVLSLQDVALHQSPPLSSVQCCSAPGISLLLYDVILSPDLARLRGAYYNDKVRDLTRFCEINWTVVD